MTVNITEIANQRYADVMQVLIRDYGFTETGGGNITKNIGGGLTGGNLNPTGKRMGFVDTRSKRTSVISLKNGMGEFMGCHQDMFCGWSAEKLAAEFMAKVNLIPAQK